METHIFSTFLPQNIAKVHLYAPIRSWFPIPCEHTEEYQPFRGMALREKSSTNWISKTFDCKYESRIRDSVTMSLEAFFLRYVGWLSWHTFIHGNSISNGQNGPNAQIWIQGNQLYLRQSHKCRQLLLCVCGQTRNMGFIDNCCTHVEFIFIYF